MRPERTETMRPLESISVRGSCLRSVEHWRSNSTRKPSAPAQYTSNEG